VLAKALRQAEMLAAEDPTLPVLPQVAERLRPMLEAAQARERAQDDDVGDTDLDVLEVSEASFNEFEELERTWAQTVSSGLAPLDTVR
jgi:predicted kinase